MEYWKANQNLSIDLKINLFKGEKIIMSEYKNPQEYFTTRELYETETFKKQIDKVPHKKFFVLNNGNITIPSEDDLNE